MAKVLLEDWKEQYRDEKIECMSRDEMSALQSEKLVKQVKNVYEMVPFYRKKMDDLGVEPGDIKGIEDIHKLPFTTKEDLRDNYPFGRKAPSHPAMILPVLQSPQGFPFSSLCNPAVLLPEALSPASHFPLQYTAETD